MAQRSSAAVWAIALILGVSAGAGCAQGPGADGSSILAAYERADRFASANLGRLVYKARVDAHWIGETHRFWYRNDVRGDREFILVDADTGRKGPAFDHARLAASLSGAAGKDYDAHRLPFDAIEYLDDGGSIRFRAGQDYWKCDLQSYECAKTEGPKEPAPGEQPQDRGPRGPRAGPPPGRGEANASPDGKWIAFIEDRNVYIRPKDGGDKIRLSDNGVEGNYYTLAYWSPDSKRLVGCRTQPGDHLDMYQIEAIPPDGVRPKLHTQMYELPGDKLDSNEMWLFDIEKRTQTHVDTDPIDWWGPPQPRWNPDNTRFTFEQTDRGFGRSRVIEVDAETGRIRTIIDEKSNTFIDPGKKFVHYLDGTHEIIWASERDGWNHLYLIDADTGRTKNQITKGEWVVRGVEKVDEDARQITFRAGGIYPDQDPYLIHYCRINFDGTGLVRLTEGNGQHRIEFSPDGSYYIDTYSRVDLAPVTELRRTSDGSLVMELERADVADLTATGWRWPEPFCAKGRDGLTDIWGVIFRPSNLDASKKYPVIESIYAGPQDSFVPKAFNVRHGLQIEAELGFIMVQIDGMGTSNRSKAFHDVCYKNLGDGGYPDRIAWIRAAAERYPYIDAGRVGVYGHSAGGYNAARALLGYPDFYKVGVAEAGNHDHRTDKVWWNELWMGYPVGPHYAEQSNVTNAGKLQGKLLLIHGAMDDNVNLFASTMQFVDALIRANKDFDLLILPRDGHGFSGTYATRRRWDYFVRNLLGVEPPKEYQIQSGAGAQCTITIKNQLDVPVAIYWVNFEGTLTKYHDLEPGAEIKQNSYVGHEWEAEAEGAVVSRYTVSAERPEWVIAPEEGNE